MALRLAWLRLNNPYVQISIISTAVLFNPGLYLAVTFLGAGGGRPTSAVMANISNGTLYGVYAVAAILFVGPIINTLGPRWTLLFGISGYPIYQGALWYFSSEGHLWFPVFAGAYLGLSAACLWTTAVYSITAYPEESRKGQWRGIQWCFIMIGCAIGTSVALGITWTSAETAVPDSVYIVFIVIQCISMGLALLVRSPEEIRRADGTELAVFEHISLRDSLSVTWGLLKDWRVLILVPAMFTPEMFFPLQSDINSYAFNLRTRILNSLLNSLINIPASLALGWLLDHERLGSRRKRALYGLAVVSVWVTGAYIAQTIWLSSWKFDWSIPGPEIDCTDSAYAGAVVIYLFFAAQYALFQNLVIYILGTFTNDPRKGASMAGLIVGLLSAGTAISFGVGAAKTPLINENAAYFGLTVLCWPLIAIAASKGTPETNYWVEQDVVPPTEVSKALEVEVSHSEGNGAEKIVEAKRVDGWNFAADPE